VIISPANALLQISVDGNPEPVDSQIVVAPSDNLILTIYNDEILDTVNTPITWALICNTANGSISGGTLNDSLTQAVMFIFNLSDVPQPIGQDKTGVWGGITVFEDTIAADSTLFSDITFHAVAGPDCLIELVKLNDVSGVPTGLVYDSVLVHVPEPVTVLLLGLGGLLLRRRK
jgi:hypothetical protein